jgi:putative membrane protein
MASVIAHSAGLIDMILWGVIALTVQILTFFVVRILFPAIVADIPAGQVSKGVFLGAVSLVVGILNAAAMS